MIERGDWGKGDDKRMLIALRDGEYEVEWAVPWESLVEGRTEQVRVCVFCLCKCLCVCLCVFALQLFVRVCKCVCVC